MAVPIFQQYMQAIASGGDVNTITPEQLANVRTSNAPIVSLPQGYAPDFSKRAGFIGGLSRLLTDPSNRSVNPALFNGVTRPTSDATKAVDLRNRNAKIQRQNEAMLNAIPNFSGSGRTSENMAGVALGNADLTMPVSSGGPSYIDKALASMRGSIPNINVPDINMPDMSLPANAYDLGAAVRLAPADIVNRLMSPVNAASIALGDAGNAVMDSDLIAGLTGREEGTTFTGNKKAREDALAAAKLIENAKVTNPSDPSNAAKTIAGVKGAVPKAGTGTAALKGTAEEDTNWFDALNSRVDLMAMGAAMLAGSGSGMGTASNFGQALQTGLGARASQAKTAQDKAYKDQLLTLQALKAQSDMRRNDIAAAAASLGDRFGQIGAKTDTLSAELKAAGIEGEPSDLKDISLIINQIDPEFADRNATVRKTTLDNLAADLGDNYFSTILKRPGGEVELSEVPTGFRNAFIKATGIK